jgi:hypothetical protein
MTTQELTSLLAEVKQGGTLKGGARSSGGKRETGGMIIPDPRVLALGKGKGGKRSSGGKRETGGKIVFRPGWNFPGMRGRGGATGFEGILADAARRSHYGGGDPVPLHRGGSERDDELWENVAQLLRGSGGMDFSGGGGMDFSGGGGADFSGGGGADFSGGGGDDFSGGRLTGGIIGLIAPWIAMGLAGSKKGKKFLGSGMDGGFLNLAIPLFKLGSQLAGPIADKILGSGMGKCCKHCGGSGVILSTGVPLGGVWGAETVRNIGKTVTGSKDEHYRFGDKTRQMLGMEPAVGYTDPKRSQGEYTKTAAEEAMDMMGYLKARNPAVAEVASYGKGRSSGGRRAKNPARSAAAKKRASTNPWLAHVAKVRSQHPGTAYKDILKIAKSSY